MQSKHDQINEYGANLLAISPMLKNISVLLSQKLSLHYPLLCDDGNVVAKKYGLVFTLADSLQHVYEDFGIDLAKANGDNSHQLPLPATYILNPNGTVVYAFVDADHTTRLDPEVMIQQLKLLQVHD